MGSAEAEQLSSGNLYQAASVLREAGGRGKRQSVGGQGDELQVFRIEADARAPGRARAVIDAAVGERFGIDLLNELKLLVSEVVTNSVRHGGAGAGDAIQLQLAIIGSGQLRVDVVDRGGGFRAKRERREDPGGWGLYLVEQLSKCWGIEQSETTRVWFQLATERDPVTADQSVLSLSA
jgi:anti-sigma regulatory factor (Ser/Thr protein kinase)